MHRTAELFRGWKTTSGFDLFTGGEASDSSLRTPHSSAEQSEKIFSGGQSTTEEQFRRSLSDANLSDWVYSLPKGIDAKVTSGGIQFSGGQRQRLALARALYRKASLLLLDEPTSSVDKESERQILKAIDQLKGNTTIVLITHNQQILKSADAVYTVSKGGVVRLEEKSISGAA
ncbi:MAG: ATP-binding cassette domain-containing protein [Bdellovibrionota bacterium]